MNSGISFEQRKTWLIDGLTEYISNVHRPIWLEGNYRVSGLQEERSFFGKPKREYCFVCNKKALVAFQPIIENGQGKRVSVGRLFSKMGRPRYTVRGELCENCLHNNCKLDFNPTVLEAFLNR